MSDLEITATEGDVSGPTYGPIIVVSGPGGVGKSTTAHLVAAAFDKSVHLKTDDLLASIVSGWVDPDLSEES